MPAPMRRTRQRRLVALAAAGILLLTGVVHGATLRVAVASNFATVIDAIADDFERRTGHSLVISLGSTGKHFAQIVNGAPFDVFLAADAERPQRLEASGRVLPGSRFTYAIGRLVVWAPQRQTLYLPDDLAEPGTARVAIANPRLAPYGRAAQETLRQLGLWDRVRPRLVRGENIGQTFQFVHSGNAAIGFIADSQLVARQGEVRGARWAVPSDLHAPIEQQAVLLRASEAAQAFVDYLRSPEVRRTIRDAGYRLP